MISWDGSGKNPHKAHGPLDAVQVAPNQVAVLVDSGTVMGTLAAGQHPLTGAGVQVPFLQQLGPSAALYLVRKGPIESRFGDKHGPAVDVGGTTGNLQHFGTWTYQVVDPTRFVMEAQHADPIAAAGLRVGQLFNACAGEWIAGGHMRFFDLAAKEDTFRQALPPHIDAALASSGLALVALGDFQATMSGL